MVWTMEPNTREGKRFSGRNQFWWDSSTPFKKLAADPHSITARDAYGLFSETKCCEVQPFRAVRQTAIDARPCFWSPAVSTYRRESPPFNMRRQLSFSCSKGGRSRAALSG